MEGDLGLRSREEQRSEIQMRFEAPLSVLPFRMIAMNPKLAVLLLCASLLSAVQARAKDKVILPDACGDDCVKFEVKALKDQPLPAPPAADKAQVILIGEGHFQVRDFTYQTFRYGLDGSWAGPTMTTPILF
jgi:hypothetical protein